MISDLLFCAFPKPSGPRRRYLHPVRAINEINDGKVGTCLSYEARTSEKARISAFDGTFVKHSTKLDRIDRLCLYRCTDVHS